MPAAVRRSMALWAGCVADVLFDREYLEKLGAGFRGAAIEVSRVCRADHARELLAGQGAEVEALAGEVDAKPVAAFVRATKPSL